MDSTINPGAIVPSKPSESLYGVLNDPKRWREHPALADLPEKFAAIKPHQVQAVLDVLDAYHDGARVVVLDAPTGSGKTVIAEIVRRLLHTTARYVCTTKGLQDQFHHDFPYSAILKGRDNYPTLTDALSGRTEWDVTAADCTKQKVDDQWVCRWCEPVFRCPYEIAKNTAAASKLAVLNTAYFLTECNGPGRFSGSPFVVIDEADTLEKQLMGYLTVSVSDRRRRELGLSTPKRVTKEEAWYDWVENALPIVESKLRESVGRSNGIRDIRATRATKRLNDLRDRLVRLRGVLRGGRWIYTGNNGEVSFKPVVVDDIGQEFLWRHGQRFLLMSATIISAEQLLDSLGFEGHWETVTVPSTFPVENRQIKVISSADMSKKAYEVERMADAIAEVVARHPGENVLVHTVSYNLASDLHRLLRPKIGDRPVFTYEHGKDREDCLAAFRDSDGDGGLCLAPSLDRGIDLPGTECRVQIIAKVPFPYLGDRQVNARLRSPGGQVWYTVQTIRTIVQMTGRAVRNENDYAVTYILDSQFHGRLWNAGRVLFPRHITEAIDWRDRLNGEKSG